MRSGRWSLTLVLAAGAMAVSSGAILVRLAQREQIAPLSIAAWRLSFACAGLLPWAVPREWRSLASFSRREWRLVTASGVCLGLHFATWISSLAYTSVASSVVLVSMGPLFVGIGSWALLGERPSGRLAAGLLLALAGSVLIGWGDLSGGSNALVGDLLALVGAVGVAGYVMIGRRVRVRRPVLSYIAPVYAVAMVTLVLTALVARSPMSGWAPRGWLWLVGIGLVPQLIGHTAYNWALGRTSATRVSLVTLLEPVGAGVLAWLLFDERPGARALAGCALILIGLALGAAAGSGDALADPADDGYTPTGEREAAEAPE